MSLFNLRPREIDRINPIYELREDFANLKNRIIWLLLLAVFFSSLCSGYIYQFYRAATDRRFKVGLLNSFIYAFTGWPILTLILVFIFMFCFYRIYRVTKKNYVRNYEDNYLKSEKETYGGAHFQTEEELRENFEVFASIEETTKSVFGTDEKGNIYTFDYPAGLNRNRVFVGAPGSGKSSGILKTEIYQHIRNGDSVICTDTKGSLYEETSAVAKAHGYITRVLMLKATWFKNSDAFNIFSTLHADDDDLDAKADVIARAIIKNTSGNDDGNDYWGLNEFNCLKFTIMYIASTPKFEKEGTNNLPGVFQFLSSHGPKELETAMSALSEDSPIKQCYNIFAQASEQNQGQIINGAASRLSKLANKYLKEVLSHDEIDFTLPMRRKCIYYIVLSDTNDAYKFVSSMFFSTMLDAMCEYSDNLTREQKKKQLFVDMLCDEYATMGGIQSLPINIASLRSRKIGIALFLQDKGQLETIHSPTETTTILNCCVIKGLLSTNDPTTAEYFMTLLGTQTVLVENLRYLESATDIVHAHNTIQKTMGEGNRALMLTEDFLNGKLSRDDIVYVISSMPPVRLKKYFSEKNGEAVHPLEKEAVSLGERKCNKRKPKWRKELELKEMQAQAVKNSAPAHGYNTATAAQKTEPKENIINSYFNEGNDTQEQKVQKPAPKPSSSDTASTPKKTASAQTTSRPPISYKKEGNDDVSEGSVNDEPDVNAGL